MALYDALGGSWREIRVAKDPAAARITELTDYEAFCGITPAADARIQEHTVTATQLATMLASRKAGLKDFELVDVRETGEYEIVSIDGSVLIPQGRILAGRGVGGAAAGRPTSSSTARPGHGPPPCWPPHKRPATGA